MLSLFPSFFDYSAVAVSALRVIVAIIFVMDGYKNLPKKGGAGTVFQKILPTIEVAGGVFLIGGLFTQAAAVILGVVSLKKMYFEHKKAVDTERRVSFYFLLFATSLSFLFLGPGLLGIDYPL